MLFYESAVQLPKIFYESAVQLPKIRASTYKKFHSPHRILILHSPRRILIPSYAPFWHNNDSIPKKYPNDHYCSPSPHLAVIMNSTSDKVMENAVLDTSSTLQKLHYAALPPDKNLPSYMGWSTDQIQNGRSSKSNRRWQVHSKSELQQQSNFLFWGIEAVVDAAAHP